MKKLVLITILVLVILGVSIFIFNSMTSQDATPQADDRKQQQDIISDSDKDNLDDVVSDFPDSAGSGFPKDIFG